jgi:hypothetical protein
MAEWYELPYPKNPSPPNVSLPRTLYPPKSGKGFFTGPDVTAYKRAVSRLGRWPWAPGEWDDGYADSFAFGTSGNVRDTGVKGVQRQSGIDQTGILGKHTFEVLRTALIPIGLQHAGQPAFDSVCLDLLRQSQSSSVPDLGPVCAGGKSVLNHDLTHATSGLPDYPAFDDAFTQGKEIIAPEDLTITGQSSSNPGDAFYATGKSGLKYWFGHLTSSPGNGTVVKKGARLSTVCANSIGGGPHVHVGIDGRPVMGHQFVYHTDYTHGAPTIGAQLAEALG